DRKAVETVEAHHSQRAIGAGRAWQMPVHRRARRAGHPDRTVLLAAHHAVRARAIAMNESEIEINLSNAADYLVRGNLIPAELLCRDVLDEAPGHPVATYLIGAIAAELGLHDDARHWFHDTLTNVPAFEPARDALAKLKTLPSPPPDTARP